MATSHHGYMSALVLELVASCFYHLMCLNYIKKFLSHETPINTFSPEPSATFGSVTVNSIDKKHYGNQ